MSKSTTRHVDVTSERSSVSTKITTTENGPLLIQGEFAMRDFDGTAVPLAPGTVAAGTVALCRCGKSKNKPFCDGSHADAKFEGTLHPDNRGG